LINWITQVDFAVLDFIYENIRCAFLDPLMLWVTRFADAGIGWIVLGLVFLFPKKIRFWGATALFAMIVGLVAGELVLKNIFCRMRPYDAYILYHNSPLPFILNAGTESSFSFPSGHTCCSFASATVYFYGNKKWGSVALVFAGLIGFSRMYNYVHFPTDVLGGMLLGILSGVFAVWLFKKYKIDDKLLKIGKRSVKNGTA